MNTTIFQCTMPIEPIAWQRVKRGRKGQAYVPGKTLRFKRHVALLARRAYRVAPVDVAIKLTARFILKPPKRLKNQMPLVRPDLDNFLKGVLDSLNGIVWSDDSRICEVHALKAYDLTGEGPRIEITVETLQP